MFDLGGEKQIQVLCKNNVFLSCWFISSDLSHQYIDNLNNKILGCPYESEGKSLLLKIPQTSVMGLCGIELEKMKCMPWHC